MIIETQTQTPDPQQERGVALVLVLIFSVLLFVVVSRLVTKARFMQLAGENEALLSQMHNQIQEVALPQVEQTLIDDLTGSEAEGLAEGGEGNPLGMGSGQGAGQGGRGGEGGQGEGEEEEEPPTDSSQDAWFQPSAHADGELTTYYWVEDENRKFNILTLGSPDEEFARLSRERLIRLIDSIREDTDHDVSQSDATMIVDAIRDWLEGRNRNDILERPPLKSDEEGKELSIPLHLDELMLLRNVDEKLFFDQVMEYDNRLRLLPGLESVLTIYTSWAPDPGDPEKQAQQGNQNRGGGGENTNNNNNRGGGEETPMEPSGEGIRININTVTRPVLRSLFTPAQIPDSVIEAILKYRNEEVEEEEGAGETEESEVAEDFAGELIEEAQIQRKIFKSLEDLEQIPEFQNLADKDIKEEFLNMLTVKSDVFSIHMAAVFKRNEERKVFVMHRRKSIVVRIESDEEDPRLHPIIHLEKRHGLRIFPVDFPDEEDAGDLNYRLSEMDEFSREERSWNPYYIDFYDKTRDN